MGSSFRNIFSDLFSCSAGLPAATGLARVITTHCSIYPTTIRLKRIYTTILDIFEGNQR